MVLLFAPSSGGLICLDLIGPTGNTSLLIDPLDPHLKSLEKDSGSYQQQILRTDGVEHHLPILQHTLMLTDNSVNLRSI